MAWGYRVSRPGTARQRHYASAEAVDDEPGTTSLQAAESRPAGLSHRQSGGLARASAPAPAAASPHVASGAAWITHGRSEDDPSCLEVFYEMPRSLELEHAQGECEVFRDKLKDEHSIRFSCVA